MRAVRLQATSGQDEFRVEPRVQAVGSQFQPFDPDWQFVTRSVRTFGQFTVVVTVWEDVTRIQNMFVEAYDPATCEVFTLPVGVALVGRLLKRVSALQHGVIPPEIDTSVRKPVRAATWYMRKRKHSMDKLARTMEAKHEDMVQAAIEAEAEQAARQQQAAASGAAVDDVSDDAGSLSSGISLVDADSDTCEHGGAGDTTPAPPTLSEGTSSVGTPRAKSPTYCAPGEGVTAGSEAEASAAVLRVATSHRSLAPKLGAIELDTAAIIDDSRSTPVQLSRRVMSRQALLRDDPMTRMSITQNGSFHVATPRASGALASEVDVPCGVSTASEMEGLEAHSTRPSTSSSNESVATDAAPALLASDSLPPVGDGLTVLRSADANVKNRGNMYLVTQMAAAQVRPLLCVCTGSEASVSHQLHWWAVHRRTWWRWGWTPK